MIKVYISTWCVPFGSAMLAVQEFPTSEAAAEFINSEARKWWDKREGDRWVRENPDRADALEPFKFGPETSLYLAIWGGEQGFQAMLDADVARQMHSDWYKTNYDDKGIDRPGYMQVAELFGAKPWKP